jgi:hypothetical protein
MHTPALNRLSTLAAAWLALAAGSAQAALVTASYSGSVTGVSGLTSQALGDHPAGTAVSWSFTFDDAFKSIRPSSGDVFGAASQPTTGSVTIGGDSYTLNYARLFSYSYDLGTDEVLWYQFQVEGSGPVTASGGSFSGLWAQLSPTMDLRSGEVGFGYGFPGVTVYSYLGTAGTYTLRPAGGGGTVPLPATAWLVLPALAWLARRQQLRQG